MDVILLIVAIVVAFALAWTLGRRRVRERYRRALESTARSVREGGEVAAAVDGGLPGLKVLVRALDEAGSGKGGEASSEGTRGGTSSSVAPGPGTGARGEEGEDFVAASLSGIADYLREGVEVPLREALESEGSLRVGAEDALVAVEDLHFYLQEVPEARDEEDLNELAREAVDEYRKEWDVKVDLRVPERPTMVHANREAVLDALYLVLHNAGTFGEGEPVDVVVRYQDGDCWLVVRDQGEGFREEALERAFEPFYSTSHLGLGLGLYHVRKIIRAMDGEVNVRNRPRGGGQVEIILPEAE